LAENGGTHEIYESKADPILLREVYLKEGWEEDFFLQKERKLADRGRLRNP